MPHSIAKANDMLFLSLSLSNTGILVLQYQSTRQAASSGSTAAVCAAMCGCSMLGICWNLKDVLEMAFQIAAFVSIDMLLWRRGVRD